MRRTILLAAFAVASLAVADLPAGAADDAPPASTSAMTAEAIFAGGCFWCIEADLEKVPGVGDVVSGYSGGEGENPTYQDHSKRGFREVVRVPYDPSEVSYERLVEIFFRSVDPTDDGGQFCDRGHSYTTAIYARSAEEMATANRVKERLAADLRDPIVTPVEAAAPVTDAEGYHQDYARKNPQRYNYYRRACRRDQTVKSIWGDRAYDGIKEKTS